MLPCLSPPLLAGYLEAVHSECEDHTRNLNFLLELISVGLLLFIVFLNLISKPEALYGTSAGSEAALTLLVKQFCVFQLFERLPKILSPEPLRQTGGAKYNL